MNAASRRNPSRPRIKSLNLKALVLGASILGTSLSTADKLIGLNFSQNDGNQNWTNETDLIGPLMTPTAFFNNTNSPPGVPQLPIRTGTLAGGSLNGLVQYDTDAASGTATTANVTWTSSNVWHSGIAVGSNEARLAGGYLDDGGTGVKITVNSLPYERYNVYIIVASDQGTGATYTSRDISVNGTPVIGGNFTAYRNWAAGSANGVWTEANVTTTGNYIVARDQTGDTLVIQGTNRNGAERCSIAAVIIERFAPPPPPPEIELGLTDRFTLAWSDVGSGADRDGSFWVPTIPAGQNFFAFGHAGMPGYGQPPRMMVGKALVGSAFAHPVGFTFVWNDGVEGTCLPIVGCFGDRSPSRWIWNPVPPAGYVSLGSVATTGAAPSTNSVVCVRSDLVVKGTVGDLIWSDAGSGSDLDFLAWKIVAPPGGIALGAFVGTQGGAPGPVYCLRASAVTAPAAPSQAEIESLISTFGPVLRFHPDEEFLPDDPAAVLDHPSTTLEWMTITPPIKDGKVYHDNFSKIPLGSRPTSSSTILDDVQEALSHPQAADGDFRYLLNYSDALRGGNLNRTKAYVRVQPLDYGVIELQFWMFYPWNDAGKSRIDVVGSVPDYFFADPTGTMGRHYSDWENIRVRVSNKNVWGSGGHSLNSIVRGFHEFDEEVAAADARLQRSSNGNPIIYVAKDSHAQYLSAGLNYYNTPVDDIIKTVDLYDLTGDGQAFDTSKAGNHIIVSSAWPSMPTTRPDWLFFGGLWGDYLKNQFTVRVEDITGIELYTEYQREVGSGKPGLIRRNEWAVARPENANLGSLRTSAGALSPAFNPASTNYTIFVGKDLGQLILTPQAADHNAAVHVRYNGETYTMDRGSLLGKASVPLTLVPGEDVITITVDSLLGSAITAEKTYTLVVSNQELLFADSFDRPDSAGLNASAAGKSGALGVLNWGTGNLQSLIDINSNTMRINNNDSDGNDGAWAWVQHNFTGLQSMTVTLDITAQNSGGDGRFTGFRMGQALADINGEANASIIGNAADVSVYRDNIGGTRGIRVFESTGDLGYFTVPNGVGTLSAVFTFADMNAGSALNYEVFWNGESVMSDATTWSGTKQNYISVQSNTADDTRIDRFVVTGISGTSDYDLWAGSFPGADLGDPQGDLDGDGESNDYERILGLDPTDPASSNPIVVPFNSAAGTFSFTRRDDALTGLLTEIETSTDMITWTVDDGAVLTASSPDANGVETVAVALSPDLLTSPRRFVRAAQQRRVK